MTLELSSSVSIQYDAGRSVPHHRNKILVWVVSLIKSSDEGVIVSDSELYMIALVVICVERGSCQAHGFYF